MKYLVPVVVLMLSACGVRTAVGIATLPVRATVKAVDLVTTSQDEADLKRGRDARKAEEKAEKERRKAAKAAPPQS